MTRAVDKQINIWYYDHNTTTGTKQMKFRNGKVLTYSPRKRQVIYDHTSYFDVDETDLDDLINQLINRNIDTSNT